MAFIDDDRPQGGTGWMPPAQPVAPVAPTRAQPTSARRAPTPGRPGAGRVPRSTSASRRPGTPGRPLAGRVFGSGASAQRIAPNPPRLSSQSGLRVITRARPSPAAIEQRREKYAYNFFRQKGYNPAAASALAGNFIAESGLNP